MNFFPPFFLSFRPVADGSEVTSLASRPAESHRRGRDDVRDVCVIHVFVMMPASRRRIVQWNTLVRETQNAALGRNEVSSIAVMYGFYCSRCSTL